MRLIIFGTGRFYRNRKDFLGEEEIVAFTDNNSILWNYELDSKSIIPPDQILKEEFDYICLMAQMDYVAQMRGQLDELGIPCQKVIDFEEYKQLLLPTNERKKRIAVFGTGIFYNRRKEIFKNTIVACFFDNNTDKWGTILDGKIVRAPYKINEVIFDYVCIMTNRTNEKQIFNQLAQWVDNAKIINFEGLKKILGFYDLSEAGQVSLTEKFFEQNQEPGKKLRKKFNLVIDRKPLISIITPFYNAGKYFEQTFNCIINQTFPWFEWIIVNDGTTEWDDINILQGLAKKDSRISVINRQNGGLAAARNTGFENSSTNIIVQVDADDLISPQYLEYVYWGLYYNPDASWAYTWSVGFQNKQYLWRKPWNAEQLKTDNYLTAFAAIRKEAWQEVGGYKVEDILYNEDWRFWLDLLSAHRKPVCLGGYLCWYRRTYNGMLSNLKQDEYRNRRNREIIEEASKMADGTIVGKEFPISKTELLYTSIKPIGWDACRVLPKENDTIRLLMIVPWMVMGGADKFNIDVVKGLSNKGYEISIITTFPSNNEWQYKFAEFTDEIFNLPEFLETPHYVEFVEYYIKSRQIDVLMVTGSVIGYYMIPYLRKVFPQLCIIDYVHMEEWYWKAGGHARTSGMIGDVLEKTYVCNSGTRNVMIEKFNCDPDDVETLYIGVDENKFNPLNVENGYLYEKLSINTERPIILFPCRIHPQKRPFMLLDIAAKVIEEMPKAIFVVVGDGSQYNELKEEISRKKLSEFVICMGQCDEMTKCYKDAKLTLICSLKEGLALTAYESCAMGVPVISSDVGGQSDLIDDSVGKLIPIMQQEKDSLNCRNFDEDEVIQYANAILDYLSDNEKYKKSSANCRERIETGFSVRLMIEKLNQEIRKLIEEPRLIEKRKTLSCTLRTVGKLADEIYKLAVVVDYFEK